MVRVGRETVVEGCDFVNVGGGEEGGEGGEEG